MDCTSHCTCVRCWPRTETVKCLPVKPTPVVDDEAIKQFEAILAGIRDGSVRSFAVVAKQNGFSRWSSVRHLDSGDDYNIIGQLTAIIGQITANVNEP
jgi:hypothetical protein